MLKTNSSEKILKYKSQNNKFKLGSIYLPKKQKNSFWCLHKDCIYDSTESFSNKLELLNYCRKYH